MSLPPAQLRRCLLTLGANAGASCQGQGFPTRPAGNKHPALLQGLLHCEFCAVTMAYSYYAMKNDRNYPYYMPPGPGEGLGHLPEQAANRTSPQEIGLASDSAGQCRNSCIADLKSMDGMRQVAFSER